MGLHANKWPARFAALLACFLILQPTHISASMVPAAEGALRGAVTRLGILAKEASGQVAGRERLRWEDGKTRVPAGSLFAAVTSDAGYTQVASSARSGGDGFAGVQSLPVDFPAGRSPPR